MEIIITSLFSAIIIYITVYSMIKVLSIAYKRGEISLRKFRLYVTASIVIGLVIASILPFGYQKILEAIL